MTDVGDSETATLTVTPFDGTTTAVLTVYDPDNAVTTPAVSTLDGGHIWTGPVTYTQAGEWVKKWVVTGTGAGVEYENTLVAAAPVPRTTPRTPPCGWVVAPTCPDWDTRTDTVRQAASALAATVMWAATGRRFGLCEITVQPCQPTAAEPLYLTYPVGAAPGYRNGGSFAVGSPFGVDGGCGGRCSCRARCETRLAGPVDSIVEITVDGVEIDPAVYQIHDRHLLVRTDGECWPTCADYSVQDPAAFEVTYLRGDPVPEAAQIAAGILACEFAQSLTGGECRLPQRLTSLSRQGVEVQVAESSGDWLDRMLTGIDDVDRVIVALNPHRMHSRPQVLSPDLPSPRHVVSSTGSL